MYTLDPLPIKMSSDLHQVALKNYVLPLEVKL